MRTALSVIAGVVLLAAIAVAFYLGGWWLREDSTNRETGIRNDRVAVQEARQSEARRAITQFGLVPESNAAGRNAIRNQVCAILPELSPSYLDVDLARFQTQEC